MKVCFFAYDKPGYRGGPIVNIRRLVPALAEIGVSASVVIIHRGSHSPCADALRELGFECRTIRWRNSTEQHVRWILDTVQDLDPDVFVPNMSVPACYAARWIRDSGVPTVVACRGDNDFHWALMDRFVLGDQQWRTSGLMCVSEELKQTVLARNHTDCKIAVIPSGVPIPDQPVARHSPMRIAFVGRIRQEQKQIHHVIDCLCQVLNRLPDASAVVIGDGPERKLCEATVASQGLLERIEFRGAVLPTEITDELKGCSVVLLMSTYEGTPGALMDAMAAGVVPVARGCPGGVTELVTSGVHGVIVSEEVRNAVDAIVSLSKDEDRWNQISTNARQRIQEHYSLAQSAAKWKSLCAELMAENLVSRHWRIPDRFDLPAVLPAFVKEDVRWWNVYRRLKGFAGDVIARNRDAN